MKTLNEQIIDLTSKIKVAETRLKVLENDCKMEEIKIKELQKGKKRKVRLELEMDSSLFLTQLD